MTAIWTHLANSLIALVYSANYIKVTGSDFDTTENIYRRVLRGKEVSAEIEPETFNHIQALIFAIQYLILNDKPITENFLKKVHAKLCAGKILHGEAGEAGEYRTRRIAEKYRKDRRKKPLFIRSRHCDRLNHIHPFEDSNGTIKRILLDVLLLKYSGDVTTYGGNNEQKQNNWASRRRATTKKIEKHQNGKRKVITN
ncbi:Fic-domain-containing protein [Hypoxylon sp. FL1150]|nr:Fic-domain-containing protein [Hypoxylon sp. FL1150]